MSLYTSIYYNLCETRKQAKLKYLPGSGLHKHHIIPKHSGGQDCNENYTYLTSREHTIAHFLLWKIHRNPNDLRSMYMLGANLTTKQRKDVGEWCRDNKIGIHGLSVNDKSEWCKRGAHTQMIKEIGIHNPDNFKKHASLGGKASIKSTNNPWSYWASKAGRTQRASLGGKSHKNKIVMYRPGEKTFERILPENVQSKILNGYVFGSPITPHNKDKKTDTPSKRRRKVTDGVTVFDSVHLAAIKHNVTSSAIIHRCNSKKSKWSYVYDIES